MIQDPSLQENAGILTDSTTQMNLCVLVKQMVAQNLVPVPWTAAQLRLLSTF